MKLRIHGNSIRFRLTRTEVERFEKHGTVSESSEFEDGGGSIFRYSLEKTAAPKLGARFEQGQLTVLVPDELAEKWTRSEQVGIEGVEGSLRLLVEKDSGCLKHRSGKDETDNYAHPDAR